MSWRDAFVRESLVLLLFVLLAVLYTWPLARLIAVAVTHPGDPLINTWILAWTSGCVTTSGCDLWDGNIFFPYRNTLAFSENLLGLLPFSLPLSFVLSPLQIHNVLVLAGFALSAYGARVMAGAWGAPLELGVLVGLLYGFIPHRFAQLSHLQFVWGLTLPLFVAALGFYFARPTYGRAVLVAAAYVLNALTNLHLFVFATLIALVVGVFHLRRDDLRRTFVPLILPAGLAAGLLLVVLHPYRVVQQQHWMRGVLDETRMYSAQTLDWISPSGVLADAIYSPVLPVASLEPERWIFPGVVFIVSVLVSVILAIRNGRRMLAALAGALILIGVLLSLGVNTGIYSTLFEHVDVLKGIRAPARWSIVAYLGGSLMLVAGFGSMQGGGRRSVAICSVMSMLFLIEIYDGSRRWYLLSPEVDPVYEWLAREQPEGAVLELPIGDRDFYYLRGAARHRVPIANGASGFDPAYYRQLVETFEDSHLSLALFGHLRRVGLHTLVVHSDALGENGRAIRGWLAEGLKRGLVHYAGRFEAGITGDYVFSLEADRVAAPADTEALNRWLSESKELPVNTLPFGYLSSPSPGSSVEGELVVEGWALAAEGIESVRVWIDNKAESYTPSFSRASHLQRAFPSFDLSEAHFSVTIPAGSRDCESDVWVQVTDRRGNVTYLPHVWFRWNCRSGSGAVDLGARCVGCDVSIPCVPAVRMLQAHRGRDPDLRS